MSNMLTQSALSQMPNRPQIYVDFSHTAAKVGAGAQSDPFYLAIVMEGVVEEFIADLKRLGVRRDKNHIVFVIDRSGSMSGRKLDDAINGVVGIIEARVLEEFDEVSIVIFDDRVETVVERVEAKNVRQIVQAIRNVDARGSTAIGAALAHAKRLLYNRSDIRERVILLTDGLIETSDVAADRLLALQSVGGVVIWSHGLGTRYDEQLLTEIAANGAAGSTYQFMDDSAAIVKKFRELALITNSTGYVNRVTFEINVDPSMVQNLMIVDAYRNVPETIQVKNQNPDRYTTGSSFRFVWDQLDNQGMGIMLTVMPLGFDLLKPDPFGAATQLLTWKVTYEVAGVQYTEEGVVEVELSNATVVNQQVVATMLRTRASMLTAQGNYAQAAALLTQTGNKKDLNVATGLQKLASGDTQGAGAMMTRSTMRTLARGGLSKLSGGDE